jgi:phosphatidylethanolamine-binding protein (PEBP) family uncharacterized protein
MEIDFAWSLGDKCSSASPKLTVTGIPIGTTGLGIVLRDHDMGSWDHGGGWVAVKGQSELVIPAGGLTSGYNGPCPPNFASHGHDYSFTVRAEGAGNTTLGTASKTATFSASKVNQ